MGRSGEDMKLSCEFICDWTVDKRGERFFEDVWEGVKESGLKQACWIREEDWRIGGLEMEMGRMSRSTVDCWLLIVWRAVVYN